MAVTNVARISATPMAAFSAPHCKCRFIIAARRLVGTRLPGVSPTTRSKTAMQARGFSYANGWRNANNRTDMVFTESSSGPPGHRRGAGPNHASRLNIDGRRIRAWGAAPYPIDLLSRRTPLSLRSGSQVVSPP